MSKRARTGGATQSAGGGSRRQRQAAKVQLPRPQIFHRAFGLEPGAHRGDIRELYPDAVLRKLCADFDIPDGRRAALVNFLAFAASLYFNIKSGSDGSTTRAKQRKQLAEIGALARKLSWKVETLDELSSRALWSPHDYIRDWIHDKQITKTDFGLTIYRQEVSGRGYQLIFLDVPDILEAVTVLGNYASDAAKRLPRARHGTKRDEALRMWLVNALAFWEEQLKRRFTYDIQAGQPVSKAFRFCCDALRPVAPDIPVSTIGTYMRRIIHGRLQRAGKIPDEK